MILWQDYLRNMPKWVLRGGGQLIKELSGKHLLELEQPAHEGGGWLKRQDEDRIKKLTVALEAAGVQ